MDSTESAPRGSVRSGRGLIGLLVGALALLLVGLQAGPAAAVPTVTDTIPVGWGPMEVAVSPNGSQVYVSNLRSDSVSVIDTARRKVTATIPVGKSPWGVAVSPNGSRVFVANSGGNSVSVIDAASRRVTGTIPVRLNPHGVAVSPNGSRVYVANSGANSVSVIDAASKRVTGTIPVGKEPAGVVVSPNGSRAYVVNSGANNVSVIDAASKRVTGTIPVGRYPGGVAVSPDGSRVYVANGGGTTVSVIDAASKRVTDAITVGRSPIGVAVSPDGSRLYTANWASVSMVDTANKRVTTAVGVGVEDRPNGVAVSPDGSRVYTANQVGTVSVIKVSVGPPSGIRLAGFPGLRQANVAWTAPTYTGGERVTGYRVRVSLPNSTTKFTNWINTPVTSRVVTGLTNGATYRVQVATVSSASVSQASTLVFRQATVASPVRLLRVTATPAPGRTTIAWKTSASNGGTPVVRYKVRVSSPNSTMYGQWVTNATLTRTLLNLRKGATYRIQVAAENSQGMSTPVTLILRQAR